MSSASAAAKTLYRRTALLRANLGVLKQKLDLMAALRQTLGPKQANICFAEKCPVVGASVGQHFRHSTDHMEVVANNIEAENKGGNDDNNRSNEIHYDIRVRGESDETDMDAAEARVRRVAKLLEEDIDALISCSHTDSANDDYDDDDDDNTTKNNNTVLACFMLSGDPEEDEFMLPSTIERELGFAAHHAIHHLAMVKIITTHTLKLIPSDALPENFGKAPSTIVYDNSQH